MDENANNTVVLDLTLKGGPPWGFRIKEKLNNVIISKINCGGRAHKSGLKVNDEIVAVNNFEVDKHPRTLVRQAEGEENKDKIDDDDLQLTKLDFTYQLIKHTINRQLHLKIKRTHGNEPTQSCCYPHTDDESIHRKSSVVTNGHVPSVCREHGAHSQSEEEMLSPAEDVELRECYFRGDPSAHVANFMARQGPHSTSVSALIGQLSFAQLGGHIDGQINGQINGQLDGRPLNGHLNGQLSGRINGQLTGQLTGNIPLPSIPITIGSSEQRLDMPQVTDMYSSHPNQLSHHHHHQSQPQQQQNPHHNHHQSQILMPELGDRSQRLSSDSIGQMQMLLERSRSALDRIDLHLPASPDCDSQMNEEFAFRSSRNHKDVWSPGSTTASSSGRSSCDDHSSSTLQMDTIATQTTPPTAHPFSGISLEELNMSHIESSLDHHMFSVPSMRAYSALDIEPNAHSLATTPAPAFLQQSTKLSNNDALNRPLSSISGPTNPMQQLLPLQRMPTNAFAPLLGPPICSPAGLCSAPFSEEELSRPLPRTDLPPTSGFGMFNGHHLGRSLPLLLDHNNNRLSIDRSNQPALQSQQQQQVQSQNGQSIEHLRAGQQQQSQQQAQSMLQAHTSSGGSPLPPPLPPPPTTSGCSQSTSRPTSRPTSRRSSMHHLRPLSPSTFSESSSCTANGGKKIGFRVGSPPPEMHFNRWTLPRNVHQQRLQRQQQHWQRLHFAELQQQRAQRSAALDDNQPRPTSARSRTPTFSKRASTTRSTSKSKKPFGPHSQLPADSSNADQLAKWQRFQEFVQSVAPPYLFPTQSALPTSYAKYLYETATHKYYTIPATVAQRGSILDLIPSSRNEPPVSTLRRRKRPSLLKSHSADRERERDDYDDNDEIEEEEEEEGAKANLHSSHHALEAFHRPSYTSRTSQSTISRPGSSSKHRKFGQLDSSIENHHLSSGKQINLEQMSSDSESDSKEEHLDDDDDVDEVDNDDNEDNRRNGDSNSEVDEDEELEEGKTCLENKEELELDESDAEHDRDRKDKASEDEQEVDGKEQSAGKQLQDENRAEKSIESKSDALSREQLCDAIDLRKDVKLDSREVKEVRSNEHRQSTVGASSYSRKESAEPLASTSDVRSKRYKNKAGSACQRKTAGVATSTSRSGAKSSKGVGQSTNLMFNSASINKRTSTSVNNTIKSNSTNFGNIRKDIIRKRLKMAKQTIDSSAFLTAEEKQRLQLATIEHYTPGLSSISVREKQMFYADLIQYIDSIFTEALSTSSTGTNESSNEESESESQKVARKPSSAERKTRGSNDPATSAAAAAGPSSGPTTRWHSKEAKSSRRKMHKQSHSIFNPECAFHLLVGAPDAPSTSSTNGYDSDSSCVIRRREQIPAPVSRSVYAQVQRGGEIPINGLQKASTNAKFKTQSDFQLQTQEGDWSQFKHDSSGGKTQQMQRFLHEELERTNTSTSMARHHYSPLHGPVIPLDRYRKAYADKSKEELVNCLLARVLFDFHALSAKEISVKKNDVVIVKRPINHNWVEVEDPESGLKGLVPRNYLDYEQQGLARAKFDFDAKTNVELSFKRADMLKLIRKVDDNWFEAVHSSGQTGIIPCNYVETIRMPVYLHDRPPLCLQPTLTANQNKTTPIVSDSSTPQQQPQQQQPQHFGQLSQHQPQSSLHQNASFSYTRSVGSTSGPSLSYVQQLKPIASQPNLTVNYSQNPPQQSNASIGVFANQRQSSSLFATQTASLQHPSNGQTGRVPSLPINGHPLPTRKLYRVLYPYRPQQADELQLIAGDILSVTVHCEDGWFIGQSTLTGQCGTFPGNYVESLL